MRISDWSSDVCSSDLVRPTLSKDGHARTYVFTGQIFFASVERFLAAFDFKEVIDTVTIDVSRAHFWDISAVAALDKAVLKFRREGTSVEVVGLTEASPTMIDRFGTPDKPGPDSALAAPWGEGK